MTADPAVPSGFAPHAGAGAFLDHVGPLFVREDDGVLGVRVEDRHLNAAGTARGGVLATLVDAALGLAIRGAADGDAAVRELDTALWSQAISFLMAGTIISSISIISVISIISIISIIFILFLMAGTIVYLFIY